MLQYLARCLAVCSFLSVFFVPAVVFAAFTASPTSGTVPLTVKFSNTVGGPLPGPVTIDYGDGSSEAIAPCTGGSAAPDKCAAPGVNTHTYTSKGTYIAKLISTTYTCQGATVGAPPGCPVQTVLGSATTTVAAAPTTPVSTTPPTTPSSTPAPTCTLTAPATSVTLGNTVNLRWVSTNSTGGTITTIGSVGPSGIQGVIPTGSGTTYVGTFAGANGKVATCSLRISIRTGSGSIYDSASNSYYNPTSNARYNATAGGSYYNELTDTYYNPTSDSYYSPISNSYYTSTGAGSYYNQQTNTYYNATTNTYTSTPNTSTTNPPNSTPQGIFSSGLVSCGATPSGDAGNKGIWYYATACGLCDFGQLIQNIINYMLALAVPISVALFAYVGVLYFGSAANPAGIEKAKGIFKTTFIGLAIAIAAYLIVQVLLSALLDQSFLSLSNWKKLQCARDEQRPRSATVSDIFAKWTTTSSAPGGVAVGETPTGFSCQAGSTKIGPAGCSSDNGQTFTLPNGYSCPGGTFDKYSAGCSVCSDLDCSIVVPTGPAGLGGAAGVPRFDALAGVNITTGSLPTLSAILTEASKVLPDGYRVVVTSTFREGAKVGDGGGTSQHASANAMDIQIVGPNGPIPNKGADTDGLYQKLAIAAYSASQSAGLGNQLAWGGNFWTTNTSRVPDLMHFDLAGDRGNRDNPNMTLANLAKKAKGQ